METPLKDTAEQLMMALANTRSRNSDTLLDWLDIKLAADGEDPPLIDLKYFAEYDRDFGFKIAVDGIHNLPKKTGTFYVVVLSLNPPGSLYTESKVPTGDVCAFIIISIGQLDCEFRLGLICALIQVP